MSPPHNTSACDDPPASRILLSVTKGFEDYELLDSGSGRKLERFGALRIDRPEPQAMWSQRLSPDEWSRADGVFVG